MGFENSFWKHLITKADGSLILTSIMQGCNLLFGKFKTSKCHSEITKLIFNKNKLPYSFFGYFHGLELPRKKSSKSHKEPKQGSRPTHKIQSGMGHP